MNVVWTDEIQYCPFCGGLVDSANLMRGTCHCMDCEAVFSVTEDDSSKRSTEGGSENGTYGCN